MMLNTPRALLASSLLVLALAACKGDDPPSTWEIVHGTANLTVSAAVHPDTRASLASYPTRTGELTINDDSTTSGWIRIAAGDTVQLDGVVTHEGDEWLVTFEDLVPAEYQLLTDGDFPNTYGLLSTAVIYSDVTGDATAENHRIYWQFEK